MMANGMMGMNGVAMGARGMGYGGKVPPGLLEYLKHYYPGSGDILMDLGSDDEERKNLRYLLIIAWYVGMEAH